MTEIPPQPDADGDVVHGFHGKTKITIGGVELLTGTKQGDVVRILTGSAAAPAEPVSTPSEHVMVLGTTVSGDKVGGEKFPATPAKGAPFQDGKGDWWYIDEEGDKVRYKGK